MNDLLSVLDRIATALEVRNKRETMKVEPKGDEKKPYYGNPEPQRSKQAAKS